MLLNLSIPRYLIRNALVFNTDTAVHGGVILQSRKLVEIMLRVRQDDDQHRCLQQYPTSTPSRVVRKGYNCPHNFRSHFAKLWSCPWHIQVALVPRQGNQVADVCAKLADCNTLNIVHFVRPPESINQLLQFDLNVTR
ncbi:hypothetical protein V6N13_059418 [Hibiscus sabdariffa]